jgi:SAM-dependent methyltransferase
VWSLLIISNLDTNPWEYGLAKRVLEFECAWLATQQVHELENEPTLLISPVAVRLPKAFSLVVSPPNKVVGTIRCESGVLPFGSDQLRRIVMLHALDCVGMDHGLLRECMRVLAPGGELILFGFNPLHPGVWPIWFELRSVSRPTKLMLAARLSFLLQSMGMSNIRLLKLNMNTGTIVLSGMMSATLGLVYGLTAKKTSVQFVFPRLPLKAGQAHKMNLVTSAGFYQQNVAIK